MSDEPYDRPANQRIKTRRLEGVGPVGRYDLPLLVAGLQDDGAGNLVPIVRDSLFDNSNMPWLMPAKSVHPLAKGVRDSQQHFTVARLTHAMDKNDRFSLYIRARIRGVSHPQSHPGRKSTDSSLATRKKETLPTIVAR